MESLKVLGGDPQCSRLSPDPQLCRMLLLPPEEPYAIRILLQPKVARLSTLERELDLSAESSEPLRVKSIGAGALLDWNRANPHRLVCAGDRILEINGSRTRAEMVDEVLDEQGQEAGPRCGRQCPAAERGRCRSGPCRAMRAGGEPKGAAEPQPDGGCAARVDPSSLSRPGAARDRQNDDSYRAPGLPAR